MKPIGNSLGLIYKGGKMKNKVNLTLLVILLFFIPLFVEGKSTEKNSFIYEVKAGITEEKEKKAEKLKKEVKTEKKEEKVEYKVKEVFKEEKKENYTYEQKDKNDVKETLEEKSRIKEIKDKIAKEKKKEEQKEKAKPKVKDKGKNDHDYYHDYRDKYYYHHGYHRRYYNERYRYNDYPGFFGGFRNFYDGFPVTLIYVRYDDYPYANGSDFNFRSTQNLDNTSNKIAFLYSSVETAYLGKDIRDTYGVTVKLSCNIYSLHLNYFYQDIFSSEESLTLYSVNGGVSFALPNFTLTPFLGIFYIESLKEARFSYGANLQVFLPANYIIDLYSLNSWYGSLNFNNFSASLNYAFYRFNIGLGFNYNNYAGVKFSGPLAKLSFWL
jgi:hypothetical protein